MDTSDRPRWPIETPSDGEQVKWVTFTPSPEAGTGYGNTVADDEEEEDDEEEDEDGGSDEQFQKFSVGFEVAVKKRTKKQKLTGERKHWQKTLKKIDLRTVYLRPPSYVLSFTYFLYLLVNDLKNEFTDFFYIFQLPTSAGTA